MSDKVPKGWKYVTHKDAAEASLWRYLAYIQHRLSTGQNIIGKSMYAASLGAKGHRFRDGKFLAGRNRQLDQAYVVKRVSSRQYIVYDQFLEIPMTKPLSLDEACSICKEMNA